MSTLDLAELRLLKGTNTSMITILSRNITDTLAMVKQEYVLASNIKSRSNRSSVQKSLNKIMNNIHMKQTPENGLIILSGLEYFNVIEPPLPVSCNYYRCDSKFHIDEISHLFEEYTQYVCLIISNEEIVFKLIKGTIYKTLYKFPVDLPNDSRRGGFSANRFQRIRQEKRGLLIDKILEKLKLVMTNHTKNILLFGCSEIFKEVIRDVTNVQDINIISTTLINNLKDAPNLCHTALQLIAKYENKSDYDELALVTNDIQTNPDLYVFGNMEVSAFDNQYLVKKIYTTEMSKFKCPNVVQITSSDLDIYGGCLGILYYPNQCK